jgi:hypothetical protein
MDGVGRVKVSDLRSTWRIAGLLTDWFKVQGSRFRVKGLKLLKSIIILLEIQNVRHNLLGDIGL